MSPEILVDKYLSRRTREDVLMAAFILRKYHQYPGSKRVAPWLRLIGSGSVPASQVDEWLAAAKIDGWKRISDLKWFKREELATVLERWAREHAR